MTSDRWAMVLGFGALALAGVAIVAMATGGDEDEDDSGGDDDELPVAAPPKTVEEVFS